MHVVDIDGRSALHKAARRGYKDIVELLRSHGADKHLQSIDGFTPLHEAAQNGQMEVVRYLVVEDKVDVEIADKSGRSAMHLTYDEESKLNVLTDRPSQYSSRAVARTIHFDMESSAVHNSPPAPLAIQFHEVRTFLRDARRPETIALLKGSYEGDENMVTQALKQYANIEAKDERMRTALMVATENGHANVVKVLITYHANMDCRDNENYTPLHRAIVRDRKDIANLLLDADANKEAIDGDNGLTPLLTAVAYNNYELAKILVQKECDLEHIAEGADLKTAAGGMPALHRATQEGQLNIVQLLVEAGANKDRKIPPMQLTPLLIAVQRGLLDIAIYLISQKVDIDAENSIGWNALRIAVESRNVLMVDMLIEKGAHMRDAGVMYSNAHDEVMKELIFTAAVRSKDVNALVIEVAKEGRDDKVLKCLRALPTCVDAQDEGGCTALHWAAFEGHVDVTNCLLTHGSADIEAVAKFGRRALLRAIENNKILAAAALIAKSADVNATDDCQISPLHVASKRGNYEAVDLLVKHKASVGSLTYDRQTPLHCAAQSANLQVVKYLVEHQADPNAADSHHQLAYDLTTSDSIKDYLFAACLRSGNVDPIMLSVAKEGREDKALYCLKSKPSSIEAKDHFGFTPLLCASAKGHLGVANLLVEKGADKEATAKYAFKPLSMAIDNGHLAVATMLIKRGAAVNGADETGNTPLHIACKRGNYESVGTLVERGANINATTFDDTTPLHRASAAGSLQIVMFLCDLGANIEARDCSQRRPADVAAGAQAEEIRTYFNRAVIARKWGLHVDSDMYGH